MELYQGHKLNALRAQKLAVDAAIKSKKTQRSNYYSQPNKCIECGCDLDFHKRKYKFCSSSCSAAHNNKKRGNHTEETKTKISKKIKETKKNEETYKKLILINREKYLQNPKKCKICGEELEYDKRHRKTCSEECKIIASVKIRPYQNGSRKSFWYFNRYENKQVLLESSWELKIAELLDDKNITWIRPKHIVWVNKLGKKKYYFPDFYLPKYDLYIDPKNKYCLSKDKEKLQKISNIVKIIYGDINEMINEIERLS
jgi:predicted nucleic acid-binding Zn ribbon protein